jgi:hypothetical protein
MATQSVLNPLTSKSSAMFSLGSFTRILVCFVASQMTLSAAGAKKKAAPAKPAEAKPVTGKAASAIASGSYLRLWKGDFTSKRTVRITLRYSERGVGPLEFGEFAPESRFSDYVAVPSGACTVEVRDIQDAATVVSAVPARFEPDFCFTISAREKASALLLEILDDNPAKNPGGELIVRNFVPDLKAIQIDCGPDLHVRLASDTGFVHICGLPRIALQVDTSGVDAAGKPVQWSNEVDFGAVHRATVLIVADPYGRVRPRVVIDGTHPADADGKEPSKAPNSPIAPGSPGEQR